MTTKEKFIDFTIPDDWELADFPTLSDIPEFSDIEVIPESRITALFGEKGSGKSALMAYLLEGSRLRHERKIFYFPKKYAFHEGTPLEITDLVTLDERFDKGGVGIDEFQQVFNKYRAATYGNRTVGSWLQQIRKRGVDLILTSNDPNQIDEALLEQVTMHVWCWMYEDKRCKDYKYHLKDCRDTIYFRVVDTHSKFGKTTFHWDGRKRRTYRIRRAIRLYKLYDTFATVDNLEIAGLDKESVMQAHEDAKLDMPYDEFVALLSDVIIPNLVDTGVVILYPKKFSEALANNVNDDGEPDPIIASESRIGRALKSMGLPAKRGSAGNAYTLPSPEELVQWQRGMG